MSTYFRENKLSLSAEKTKYIVFSKSRAIQDQDLSLVVNNNNINESNLNLVYEIGRIKSSSDVPAYKYLGVFFDENLDFKYHLRNISSKLSRALFALRSVKKVLPSSALISLYYALFHCHLVYAIEIWSCASWSNINELYLKQRAAIRIISNSTYNAHTQPLFNKLKILPLNLMVDFFKIKFMHSVIKKTAPISFHDIWPSNRDKRLMDNPGYDSSVVFTNKRSQAEGYLQFISQ